MRQLTWCVCVMVIGLAGSSPALAWQDAKAAATDPALADADFTWQGEYAGPILLPGYGSMQHGLQVVALGRGKFDGVLYAGGLPGSGWDKTVPQKLSGQLADGKLTLSGERNQIAIARNVARVLDQSGRELGRLIKTERVSATLGLQPPHNAIVLFDGKESEELPKAKIAPDGLLLAGVTTKLPVNAFRLHLEFRTPYMPQARGQARGNSGVYIQQRYEVQILDSFGLEGVENECGSLYRQTRPAQNMCLPPLAWQTYDIWFTPPKFAEDGKTKTENARITVLHNGVAVHRHREITAKTGGGKVEGPEALPIVLQDHGNPVTFRNIWLVAGEGDEGYSRWRPSQLAYTSDATYFPAGRGWRRKCW
jgi:hypothetical protein